MSRREDKQRELEKLKRKAYKAGQAAYRAMPEAEREAAFKRFLIAEDLHVVEKPEEKAS